MEEKKTEIIHPEKIVKPVGDLNGFDINRESIKIFSEKIMLAKTILWNGPFGKFEDAEYAKGTLAIARAIIDSGAFSVVGGGETVEFLEKQSMIDKFSHVSTGGGAMLAYLAGDKLPGLEALK
jgi:phosphoglycerate kinase